MDTEKSAPILIAYSRPLRLILRDNNDTWAPAFEDLNLRNYEWLKLHRLTTSFDVGLGLPLCLHVGFNGALILPLVNQFRDISAAVQFYNDFLGKLLLGGIFSESVIPSEISIGMLNRTGYFRSLEYDRGEMSRLHVSLQLRVPGNLDVMSLLKPSSITAWVLHQAWKKGEETAGRVPLLRPSMLLRAISSKVSGAWPDALWNAWICIEQAVEQLWNNEILHKQGSDERVIPGRSQFLKDYRTWTISAKTELLFQRENLDFETYSLLSQARKARNQLAHYGVLPNEDESFAAVAASLRLISLASSGEPSNLLSLLGAHQPEGHQTQKLHFATASELKKVDKESISFHMGPLPPIPGDLGWTDTEYERVIPDEPDSERFTIT